MTESNVSREATFKKSICLDFDGVIHHHLSPYLSADRVVDGPTPGAMEALRTYTAAFWVSIYSGRTGQTGGVYAMQAWLLRHLKAELGEVEGDRVFHLIRWPHQKPLAFVAIDDRCLTFTGQWPTVEQLAGFKPWNKGKALAAYSDSDLVGELKARGWWVAPQNESGDERRLSS